MNKIGIILEYSDDGLFYGNNFVNNSEQVVVSSGYRNSWNLSYPAGGNYWSDYNGSDCYCGTYQNETGMDCIGDTPYLIAQSFRDNYPLLRAYRVLLWDVTGDGDVTLDDVGLVVDHFGSYPSHHRWTEYTDMNCDYFTGIDDIVSVAEHIGESV
jgi:hypothetical protein